MILELDTSLFDIGDITINQLVFLTLCLNGKYQTKNQDIHQFLSRISESEIQGLIDQDLISCTTEDDSQIYTVTDKLKSHLRSGSSYFDEFYNLFPAYVTRPDGTKGFLRTNLNKCRKEYNRIIGKSKAMHEHICDCLKYEIDDKMMTGKLGYMKTMWKWLTQREWEVMEEQMQYNMEGGCNYGYDLK